jgi:hypothetical protein
MKYWEIIADKLSAAGWSWGLTTAIDAHAGKLFVVDAHRSDSHRRFIVRSDELLTAFLELERATEALLRRANDLTSAARGPYGS